MHDAGQQFHEQDNADYSERIGDTENAFKHGVSPSQPSFVHISIRMVKEGTLVCTIENSDFPKTDADRNGSGIGLQNLRKRLNLLYPNRHILRTENLNGSFVAQLIIDL